MRHLDNRPATNAPSRVFQDLGLLGISGTYILIFSPAQNSRRLILVKGPKELLEIGGSYTGRGKGESEAYPRRRGRNWSCHPHPHVTLPPRGPRRTFMNIQVCKEQLELAESGQKTHGYVGMHPNTRHTKMYDRGICGRIGRCTHMNKPQRTVT